MAFWPTYWLGLVLAGGRQAGATVLEITTGASNTIMAMSLALPKTKTKTNIINEMTE
jgi:hypothetical protein